MAMTYMTHPKHGAMHVYTPTDVEAAKALGWVESVMPTAEEIVALKAKQRLEAAQAEVARLESESKGRK